MKKITAFLVTVIMLFSSVSAMAAQQRQKKADYKYSIDVSIKDNQVIVYSKDSNGNYTVPYKTFVCSTGRDTPTSGTYYTSDKYEWRLLVGNVYGQYATRITGPILFHSVPYFKQDKSTLEYEEYNKLGTKASLGCIRLSVADSKWIYDNCPSGTRVRMISDTVKLPLKKPDPIKIDTSDTVKRNWDPTDPDVENPWNEYYKNNLIKQPSAKTATEQELAMFQPKRLKVYSGGVLFVADVLEKDGSYYASMSEILYFLKEVGITTDTTNTNGNGFAVALDKTCTVTDDDLNKIIMENAGKQQNKERAVILCLNKNKVKTTAYKYDGKNMFNLNTICSMANCIIETTDKGISITKP